MAVIWVPALNPVFNTAPLSAADPGCCLLLSSLVFSIVEPEKFLRRKPGAGHIVHAARHAGARAGKSLFVASIRDGRARQIA